jgi:hypothetical protein
MDVNKFTGRVIDTGCPAWYNGSGRDALERCDEQRTKVVDKHEALKTAKRAWEQMLRGEHENGWNKLFSLNTHNCWWTDDELLHVLLECEIFVDGFFAREAKLAFAANGAPGAIERLEQDYHSVQLLFPGGNKAQKLGLLLELAGRHPEAVGSEFLFGR